MIEAVLFDLYETLITESGLHPTRASSLAATLGLEERAYRAEWKARRPRVVTGHVSFGDALSEISQMLTGSVDAAAVQRICEQREREKTLAYRQIEDEIMAMVTGLAGRGIRLVVISNGFTEDVRPWPTCPLARVFECSLFSSSEGVAKPDPEIYLRALNRLGVRAETAVYIGDGGDDELSGAKRVGLRACRAAWFARKWFGNAVPGLAAPRDVVTFVAAG